MLGKNSMGPQEVPIRIVGGRPELPLVLATFKARPSAHFYRGVGSKPKTATLPVVPT
jgi:hypothetical protein